MTKTLKAGDKVAWNTSQGETQGKVVKTLTTPTKIKTHKVAASKANPEVLVRSDKSGDLAAHKPGTLKNALSGTLRGDPRPARPCFGLWQGRVSRARRRLALSGAHERF